MREPAGNRPANAGETAQRVRNTGYVLQRLWRYLKKFRLLILLCAALVVSSNLLSLAGPRLSGQAINAMQPGKGAVDLSTVLRYAGQMLLCYLAAALLGYFLTRLMIYLSKETVRAIRRDLFNRLVELPVSYFDTHTTGDTVSRMSYDIDTIGASLSTDFLQIVNSVITVAGCAVMMLSISWRLSILFGVTVPCIIWFANYRNRRLRPLFRKRSASLGALNGFTEEIISGMKTIKAYNREQAYIDRFDACNEAAVNAYYESDYASSVLGPSMNFINNVALSALGVFGGVLFLRGSLTLGALSSFILYSRKFSGPINEVANIFGELQSALAAGERVFTLIDTSPEPPDAPYAETLEKVRGSVEMQHIDFGYTPEKMILRDLQLAAAPGSTTAIVGTTGAGKTTVINLLMRFYDPQKGTIRLDERSTADITRESLRASYAMVLQDTWLFNGTIYDNIAYGRPTASRAQVEAAAKAAKIHDYIVHLPGGYETVLTEDGTNISKGQKQLLTIARAMLLDSPMLILDEATSNVDTRTELRIQAAMHTLMQGRTCFVIAHRLSTIQNADNILVMQNGTVAEQGTHTQLLAKNGLYAQMYNAQFA